MSASLSYAVVTPARDEAANLRRLAVCLAEQDPLPATWLVVDDSSADGTAELVEELAARHAWIRLLRSAGGTPARGAPIVRAFHAGLAALEPLPDVVVKLDADVSIEPGHFRRLLEAFAGDERLGMAGGVCYEQAAGVWRRRHGTGPPVWGANRAYRRDCLRDVLPLEEHMGWDTLDQMKANLRGWKTELLDDLPFRHHRAEGERDGHAFRSAAIRGEGAHYLGYRPSYLLLRTLFRSLRHPAAVGLLVGYARAAARRGPRCADPELRAYVRRQQSLRNLPQRAREALGPRAALADPRRRPFTRGT